MRNLKRFLAMTLTVLMVVGSFSFASFAQKFDDVYDYADAIDVLSDLGVIWGYEDGTFGPDNTVERWHMALWIAKMETGKVTTDDYLTIWRAEENYTDFTDVIVDQAIGAINYAADEKIIIGTTPTTFAPTAGITYQDALTMVVRALGFGGKAMDAGYPWKYINKAAELGLEEGLSGIAYKDVLTRAETAQILYNALNTVDADGKTYIADVFGLTTVVITGTTNYRIIETESVAKKDYVSFNVLNADGTLNDDVTYHLPAAAFGIEPAKADKYVGASFKVTTDDNFKTLGTVIENPSEVFDAAKITGEGTPAAPNGAYVTLGEDKYDAVKKYSSLYNAQGIKGNIPEIIVYVTNIAQESADGYFKVDSNYNILDVDGKIVAYYRPDITGSYLNPYAKKLQNDVFYMFPANADGQKDAIKAAGGVWYSTKFAEYKLTENTYDLVKNNKYATAKAYDDNGDGVYDRLFYTYHEFGKIYANTDTPDIGDDYYIETGLAKPSLVVKKFIDGATGEALAAAPSGYIRYSYDPLSKYLTVYENYTFGTGLVTTVNKPAAKIVIGGTQYSVGIATYPGAAYDNTGVLSSLVGKQVNYILADGVVIRVFDSAVATNYIVFDNLTGLTSAGYATALAYVQSNQASVITIATINGYSYQNYALLAQQGSLSNITGTLKTGMLFTGTKDALGFWHLTEVEDYTYLAFEPERNFKFWKNRTQGKDYRDPDAEIFFRNGIANTEDRFYYDGKNYGTLKSFAQFNTNANTLYIVYNESKDRFYTAKGIPVNDAKILVDEAVFVDVYDDASTNGPTARFVYVYDGTLEGQYLTNAWQAYEYDTVIYVDHNSVKDPLVTNDLGSTGTLLGSTWQYNRVLDMINGKWITVQTAYNFQLKPETFYTVSNGYVEAEVDLNDGVINEGLLKDYGIFYSIIEPLDGRPDIEYSAYTYLYELDADGNVVFDPNNGNLINKNKEMATDKLVYVPVYYYVGDARGSRVLLYINGAKTIQDAFPKAAEKGNIGVAENKDATIKVDYFYIPYKYTPKSYNYADNFTALKANEKSPVNYFLIPQALYEALSDHNRLHRHEWNENINISTYDDWMRIYDKDGKEVENWAADFTMLIDNVTVGSNVVKAPVYAMGIQQSPNHAYKPLDAGIYTIRFKYNNEIYVVYVQLQLEDVPTLLSDLTALIYDVDKFNSDHEFGQDGEMDTGRIFLKTNSNFADYYNDVFDIDVYAIPYYNVHWDSAHGEWSSMTPRMLILDEPKGLVPIWGSDDFRFDEKGEAVIDMQGRFVQERNFECISPNCWYDDDRDFAYGWWNDLEDSYYYAMMITRKSTGEKMFITEFDWINGFKDQAITFAPSFDVKVEKVDDDTAEVSLKLDEEWDTFNFAQQNTTMTLSNQFKFGRWGSGIAYDMLVTAPASVKKAAIDGYTWTINTDPDSFDSSQMFDQNFEIMKNFGFSWAGQAYHSYQGTYTFPTFAFGYVLPYNPKPRMDNSPLFDDNKLVFTTDEDVPLSGSLAVIELDGDKLEFALVDNSFDTSYGELKINKDGTFTFNPAANKNGTVTFKAT